MSDIDARESDIRDQFKPGKLPPAVFKTWLAEFAREREALIRCATASPKSARITRADFLQQYKSAVSEAENLHRTRNRRGITRSSAHSVA